MPVPRRPQLPLQHAVPVVVHEPPLGTQHEPAAVLDEQTSGDVHVQV
jgi:hypothetical protein